MSITLLDIAKKTGVSSYTVSRALNNKPDISKKTKKLIIKVAKELNYTPNSIARSLVQKKTNTLGVLLPNIADSFYAEILSGIERMSRNKNYNILYCNTDHDPIVERKSFTMLLEKRVDGILICPTEKNDQYIKMLREITIPYVLIKTHTDLLDCDNVFVDVTYGAYLAVNHLIKKGYKKIYQIYSMAQNLDTKERIEGCKKAFKKNKISLDKLELIYSERKLESFYNITEKYVNYTGEKVGIFVFDDEMAMGVYKALTNKGLKVPEQVGIVGYDNIKISPYFAKSLTTVHYPKYEIGVKGTELLIKRIKLKNQSEPNKIILKPKLIIRETT